MGLELVTQGELHYAVGIGLGSDLAEGGRVKVGARIGKVGVVKGVVGFRSELNGVFVGPRHQEALGERHIEVDVAGTTQIVAIADFAAERIGKSSLGSSGIRE